VLKQGGVPQGAVPCLLHDVEEASALHPEWLEDKPPLPCVFLVQSQQQGGVIRAVQREVIKIASWINVLLVIGDEGTVNAF
jgi:hypothetical protein